MYISPLRKIFWIVLIVVCAPCLALADDQAAQPSTDKTPAAVSATETQTKNPFSDQGTSGQPCEFLGPCGRCDCGDAAVKQDKTTTGDKQE